MRYQVNQMTSLENPPLYGPPGDPLDLRPHYMKSWPEAIPYPSTYMSLAPLPMSWATKSPLLNHNPDQICTTLPVWYPSLSLEFHVAPLLLLNSTHLLWLDLDYLSRFYLTNLLQLYLTHLSKFDSQLKPFSNAVLFLIQLTEFGSQSSQSPGRHT